MPKCAESNFITKPETKIFWLPMSDSDPNNINYFQVPPRDKCFDTREKLVPHNKCQKTHNKVGPGS